MHVIYKRCHLVEWFETSSKFYWSVQHSALGSAVPLAMFRWYRITSTHIFYSLNLLSTGSRESCFIIIKMLACYSIIVFVTAPGPAFHQAWMQTTQNVFRLQDKSRPGYKWKRTLNDTFRCGKCLPEVDNLICLICCGQTGTWNSDKHLCCLSTNVWATQRFSWWQ